MTTVATDARPDLKGLWKKHLLILAFSIAAILLIHARDVVGMATIWWTASTFQHCLFIVPLTVWLVAQRRHEVVQVEPRAWLPGLALGGVASLAWLLGEAGGVSVVRHAAIVLMVQASVLAILGLAVSRALIFPLFYLVFLVPFGEEFVPALQTLTAKIVIGLVHLTGLPARIDGVFITTAAGWFEVAEACSGVKFLVAMIAYGALVANVCFKSWKRRAAFMALCVGAPIVANGVRAFATIYAAHLTSAKAAAGFDHIIYGWVFFALVMALVMAIGWRFFDRRLGDRWLADRPQPLGRVRSPVAVALAAMSLVALTPLWSGRADNARRTLPDPVTLPIVAGWQMTSSVGGTPWRARFDGADHKLYGHYASRAGRVDLAVALYGWQAEGREIVSYGQGAIDPDGRWAWTADVPAPPGARAIRMMAPGRVVREAVTFHVVGGRTLADPVAVKVATLTARLGGGDQRAATLIVSSDSRQAIDAFLGALGPPETVTARLFAQAEGR